MLLQIEHKWRLALTWRIASASNSASSSLERRMWKASRCAVLPPTPGSFFNSSMSRAIGSANLDKVPHGTATAAVHDEDGRRWPLPSYTNLCEREAQPQHKRLPHQQPPAVLLKQSRQVHSAQHASQIGLH